MFLFVDWLVYVFPSLLKEQCLLATNSTVTMCLLDHYSGRGVGGSEGGGGGGGRGGGRGRAPLHGG